MSLVADDRTRAAALGARNLRLALLCAAIVVGMLGLAYASVPLYELFCRVTGYAGTPGRADAAPRGVDTANARRMTVRFDANVARDLPWAFEPAQGPVRLPVGEETLVFFRARNTGDAPIVGTATFAVTPHKAAPYFDKLQCFCFTEQVLRPGETVEMPVSFFIDPRIVDDRGLDDISTLTLSYTFLRAPDQSAAGNADSAPATPRTRP